MEESIPGSDCFTWSPGMKCVIVSSPPAASPLTRVRMLAPSADPGVTQINWTLFSATLSLTTSPDPALAIRDLRLCPHWNLPIMITPPGPRDSPDWFRINLI